MQAIVILIIAALVFLICRVVDKLFSKLFRSKAQHRSGMAIRASKRYGIFGVMFSVLGILGIITGCTGESVLTWAGLVVLLMGIALAVHYLSFGIFYDGESFLLCRFGRKSQEHRYDEIVSQKLYVLTGGSTVIELTLKDGSTVSVQSTMDGVYPFMDTAFAGWCMETGRKIEDCDFYDPSKSWWFPHEEEV
ncbi:MAG: hypothetical protein PUK18_12690 [Firmicutes bacterium]|nr:hypothetical protein [Bacillota bacterium]MDY6160308.1 hypothetical protein [Candidatus Faecousia sp.]